jgi:hypothetical protein
MAQSGSLHRLIYVSSAVGILRADELDRILLRSKASNTAAGITGLLLLHEGSFLQVIEGSPAGVLSLMERIRRDRRHSSLMPLESAPCSARAFPAWAMGYVAPRNLSDSQRRDFSEFLVEQRRAGQTAGVKAPLVDHLWSFLSSFREIQAA